MRTQTFYSNGKLLITGEYLVLDGATALALPTKFGQHLTIAPSEGKKIIWKSFDSDGSIWFDEVITFDEIANNRKSENAVKNTLVEILYVAFSLGKDYMANSEGYTITTRLTFPKSWGLGTSSTLINNIAQWLQIDAFDLLRQSFGGSGYDIACAQHSTAILYALENDIPVIHAISFNPQFRNHLYFVYLNKKQSSKEAIASYKEKRQDLQNVLPVINAITQSVAQTEEIGVFESELQRHEDIVSAILGVETVKGQLFSDFNGTIKSLGAWGGDFVLAISPEDPTAYFSQKGFDTVIPFSEMIL